MMVSRRWWRSRLLTLVFGVSAVTAGVGVSLAGSTSGKPAGSKPQDQAPEVDHVELAAVLISDGHYDRAERVLSQVEPEALSQEKRARYHLFLGLIRLRARAYLAAIESFDKAIEDGQNGDIMFVYLAQCYYHTGQWEMTARSVDNAAEQGAGVPELQLMKAHALIELERRAEAWDVLERGARRFPGRPEFLRQQTFLLVNLELYQAAMEVGLEYLERISPEASDYVAIAMAFRQGQRPDEAIRFLEQARLLFPDDERIIATLASAYADVEMEEAAADLLQRSAENHPEFIAQSAELYRRSGSLTRALYMNARVEDQKEKFKQRASILLDQQRFEEVANMGDRLERIGLLEDQNLVYALAYANFKAGAFHDSERYIKRIDDPRLFEHATQLRQIIARCERDPAECAQ
jgi:tetratricopeptide (TPR) repeat protein